MRNYLTEFIGTFFLVLTIGLTVNSGSPYAPIFAPIAIGASLMIMVYMGGHVSGGHYNPAVSLAILIRGKMAAKDIVPYWIAQVAGAFVAAMTIQYVTEKALVVAPGAEVPVAKAVLVEILYTFALALVVLNAATAKGTSGNSFYGLAIGFTVTVAAFAAGGVSGGAFNPAVGTGPILWTLTSGAGSMSNLWIYWAGPMAGGLLAALAFKAQNPGE